MIPTNFQPQKLPVSLSGAVDLDFSIPDKNEDDLYISSVSMKGSPAVFETPYLTVNTVSDDGMIELKVDDELYKVLRAVDNHVVQTAFDCRKDWFGKNLGLPKIEKFYRSPLHSEDQLWKGILNREGDDVHTTFFRDGHLLQEPALNPGVRVKLMIQLKEICMSKTAMVPKWVIQSVKYPSQKARKHILADLNKRQHRLRNLI